MTDKPPLSKVADGVLTRLPTTDIAREMTTTAIWCGLALGVWGGSPEVGSPLFVAGLVAGAAFWFANRREDAPDQPEPGVWRASRKTLFQARWKRRVPFGGLGIGLLLAGQSWWYGDAWGVAYALALCGGFSWLAWRRPPLEDWVELRIDAAGLYAREFGYTIPWPVLQAVRPRARHRAGRLGLRLGPNALPGLDRADQAVGRDVEIDLSSLAVGVDVVRAEIFRYRPDLEAGPTPDAPPDSIVTPIPGASGEAADLDDGAMAAVAMLAVAQNPALALIALSNTSDR
ncbi:hypothetical protein SGCZBJ_05885 [Caulobacter zeae]|uniref:Uncharacterized protein n=1 Tax=Caulobacter zeae TaxID=2055137 RepID=A0A2N5DP83_9CAUL|nr:hypothetical protein [Caulobacter zeae]PLR27883.1 hypothetical protein SGCZBJ_05885 [Caulobacter zeae]